MAENPGERAVKRVFVSVSPKSRHWPKAWESSEEMIEVALAKIKENDPTALSAGGGVLNPTFLVKERWTSQIWIVFDIFNDTYDPGDAHLPGRNDLQVIIVALSERDVVTVASKLIEDRVNKSVQQVHDSHGVGSRPLFTVDHANGNIPSYPNPTNTNFQIMREILDYGLLAIDRLVHSCSILLSLLLPVASQCLFNTWFPLKVLDNCTARMCHKQPSLSAQGCIWRGVGHYRAQCTCPAQRCCMSNTTFAPSHTC
ncbi:hypothetical protein MKZ38_006950 [Zalerion maritima]|uniref:Uncharacterized protein n=1 Tax=Zalerion maritima TaxID=339359 RepID=A0AAD5WW49_9PEZI|nr:hypothetical protein MKZ38_006950 [Zalerion maritima]